ncbi:MAG: hypothetical protein WC716_16625, partial [Chitinophagaceae bacterium]
MYTKHKKLEGGEGEKYIYPPMGVRTPPQIFPLISILSLLAIFSFASTPGLDFDNIRWFAFQIIGVSLFCYTVLVGFAINGFSYPGNGYLLRNVCAFICVLCLISARDYVPGYTLNELAKWVAFDGIVLSCAGLNKSSKKIIGVGLICFAVIQIADYVFNSVRFTQDLGQLYSWGTFRHRIRFA